jgi:hypothetical protein
MRQRLILMVAFLTIGTGCGRAQGIVRTEAVIAIQTTDLQVRLVTHSRPSMEARRGGAVVFFNMHDDENTSVSAGLDVLRARGGTLVELQHTGARNFLLRRDTARYAADPNRIYTDAGARATLERLGRFDLCVHAGLRAFADTVLARTGLDTARTVVTLHNNTDERYSARSYAPGAEYAADAAAVYLHPGADPDDFFFVTERPLFNVVLQDNARVTDDGSLSVLAARRGQRYVNVEAQHGHRREQERMIHALLDVLARL